jgi:hypothetical protein
LAGDGLINVKNAKQAIAKTRWTPSIQEVAQIIGAIWPEHRTGRPGFRVHKQNANVDAEPWSAGECRTKSIGEWSCFTRSRAALPPRCCPSSPRLPRRCLAFQRTADDRPRQQVARLRVPPGRVFWDDDLSLVGSDLVDPTGIATPEQVADTYLLAPALGRGAGWRHSIDASRRKPFGAAKPDC